MSSQVPGYFLPINQVFSQDDTQFLLQITKLYADIARSVNARDISVYALTESSDGQQWFNATNAQPTAAMSDPIRIGFRKVFSIGAIGAGVTLVTLHGLTNVKIFTYIGGAAVTAVPDNRPIPYASATLVTNQIEIKVDATNITIINGATAPAITSAVVVLEYLKS